MICRNCKLNKDRFYKGNRVCVECYRARRYAHRRNNPKLRMLASARQRAKVAKVPFNLKQEDFEIPEYCPILGIKMKLNTGVGGFREDSPSLDRQVPELGYVPGNVSVISFRANRMKSDATLAELEKVTAWVREQAYAATQAALKECLLHGSAVLKVDWDEKRELYS